MAQFNQVYFNQSAYSVVTAGSALTADGLPQLAGDIAIIANLRGNHTVDQIEITTDLNEDAIDGNYARQYLRGSDSSLTAQSASDRKVGVCPGDGAPESVFGAFVQTISDFAAPDNDPHLLSMSGHYADSTDSQVQVTSSRRDNAEAVTKYQLKPALGTGFLAGSMLSAYHIPKNVIAYKKLESDAASVTLVIPQGYKHLKVSVYARTDRAAASSGVTVNINNDTDYTNYVQQKIAGDGSSVGASQPSGSNVTQRFIDLPAASAGANFFGGGHATFFNYTKTDRHKHYLSVTAPAEDFVQLKSGRWANTAAITSLVLTGISGDNFVAGSLFVVEGTGKTDLDWEDDQIDIDTKALVDWDNDGKYDGTYDDISADVTKLSISAGRDVANALTGKVKAGRATLTIANDDDRYSPSNTGSVLTGNLVPKRTVKIRTEAPVVRDLFTGHIERIEPSVSNSGRKTAKITCLGVFGELTQNEVNIAYAATKASGSAVGAILDAAGWSATDRVIDTGTETFENWDVDQIQAMTALRRAEESEPGLLVETKEGKIGFEDRDHRMVLPHVVSQAEYSDDPTATGAFKYEGIKELDPLRFIFNDFRAQVSRRATNAGVTLWTHPEANTTGDAPELEPGDSVTYWAQYPNPASRTDGDGVSAWTALVATTDYTANASSDGTGTDLTASVGLAESDFAKSKKIVITNNHATSNMFITKLQNRGTEIYNLDPVSVRAEDATSQTAYGQRTFNRSDLAVWIPDTFSAQEWAEYMLSLFKDPSPMVSLTITGQKSLYQAIEILTRTISDRIGIEADGNAGLGFNEDFFVENYAYDITPRRIQARFQCSSAAAFSTYWTLGYSLLGTETRLNAT